MLSAAKRKHAEEPQNGGAYEQRREKLYLQLKQERELLEKPLSDFNNKEEAVEQLKLALKDIIFNNVLRLWEGHKDNIDAVSEKLVKIPELQNRSAYDLAFLIRFISEDKDFTKFLQERLENENFFIRDSIHVLHIIAKPGEYKITDQEINNHIIRIIEGSFNRELFESTTQGGGLNKSRKKKSLE